MKAVIMVMLMGLAMQTGIAQQKPKELKVDELVQMYQSVDGVAVVNFWSTWCQPCVEEMPHFISITRQYAKQGVNFIPVSQDTKKLYESGGVTAFIKKKQWQASFVWLNETDAEYYCPKIDKAWQGGIPATLIINTKKNYRAFFEESLTEEQLKAEIEKAL